MNVKVRRPLIALSGVVAMIVGLIGVTESNAFAFPFNIFLIVGGMIGAVTGGLVFGVVAVAWVMKQAMQLSESSYWGRSRQR
jgi:uncharacterized membrane protein